MLKFCKNEECGKAFTGTIAMQRCPECQKVEEEFFGKIQQFMTANPGSTVREIHEWTSIPLDIILKFTGEKEEENTEIRYCSHCNKSLEDEHTKLSLCRTCAHILSEQMKKTSEKSKKPKNPKEKYDATDFSICWDKKATLRVPSSQKQERRYGLGSAET